MSVQSDEDRVSPCEQDASALRPGRCSMPVSPSDGTVPGCEAAYAVAQSIRRRVAAT